MEIGGNICVADLVTLDLFILIYLVVVFVHLCPSVVITVQCAYSRMDTMAINDVGVAFRVREMWFSLLSEG